MGISARRGHRANSRHQAPEILGREHRSTRCAPDSGRPAPARRSFSARGRSRHPLLGAGDAFGERVSFEALSFRTTSVVRNLLFQICNKKRRPNLAALLFPMKLFTPVPDALRPWQFPVVPAPVSAPAELRRPT